MPNSLEEMPQTTPFVEAPPKRRIRSGSRAKFIVLFVLLLVIAGAVYAYTHFQDRVSSDDANVDGHISAVAPKITGNVVEVPVLDNQPVKAGDVLVRIDAVAVCGTSALSRLTKVPAGQKLIQPPPTILAFTRQMPKQRRVNRDTNSKPALDQPPHE